MQLRAEHLDGALGIGERRPRLSWRLPPGRGRQVAYELRSTTAPRTGRGRRQRAGAVAGPPTGLRRAPRGAGPGRDRRAARAPGRTPSPSRPGCSTPPTGRRPGSRRPRRRTARGTGRRTGCAARSSSTGPSARARLYATAHGIYELELDGAASATDELTPGFTEYAAPHPGADLRRHRPARARHATCSARCSPTGGTAARSASSAPPTSGAPRPRSSPSCTSSTTTAPRPSLGTDATWRWSRLAHPGRRPDRGPARGPRGCSAGPRRRRDWQPVAVSERGYDALVCSPAPPVRPVEELRPVSVTELRPGVHVVDLGQNINGRVRLIDLGPAGHRAHADPRRGARPRRRRDHGAPAARRCRSCPSR